MQQENTPKRRNHGPSGPLYDLLTERLPNFHQGRGNGRLSLHRVAREIGVSYQHLYQVLPSGDKPPATKHLSVQLARKLIDCSEKQGIEKPLTLLDLEPFLPS